MNSDFPLTLYYDGDCQICRAEMRNLELRDVYGQLRFVNIAIAAAEHYPPGTDRTALMTLIHARCADGRVLNGVEVFRLAYSAVGMPWVARLTSLPGIRALSEAIYPLIARHRYRLPQWPIRWVFERALRASLAAAHRAHCGAECRDHTAQRNDGVHS
jgi:predicted DCC family thiol-disulfide oxidoreductase YuxK